MNTSRTRTLSLLLIAALLAAMSLVVGTGAAHASTPLNQNVVGLADTTASIMYDTVVPENATANYGTSCGTNDSGLTTPAPADSGTPNEHLFTLTGLSPSTTYYYDIVSGGSKYDNAGSCFSFTTLPNNGATTTPTAANGSVFTGPSCNVPVTSGFVTVTDSRSGSSSTPNFAPITSTTSPGTYTVYFNPAGTAGSSSWYTLQGGDTITVTARIGSATWSASTTYASGTNPVAMPNICLYTHANTALNTVVNPGFEADSAGTGWTVTSPSTISTSTSYTFQNSLQATAQGTSASPNAYQDIQVFPNTKYELSGWVNQNTASDGYLAAFDDTSSVPGTFLGSTGRFPSTGGWYFVAATITTGASTTKIRLMLNNALTTAGQQTYFDDVAFSELPGQIGNADAEVTNPSSEGWIPNTTSGSATGTIATTGCRTGTQCFQVSGTAGSSLAHPGFYQDFPVSPGSTYVVTAWINQDTTQNAYLGLFNNDGNTLTTIATSFRFKETGGWYMAQVQFTPSKPTVRLLLNNVGAGTTKFDSISLYVIPGTASNGGFENDNFGSNWVLPYTGSIDTSGADAHAGNNSFRNVTNATGGEYAYQDTLVFSNVSYNLTAYLKQTVAGGYLQIDCNNNGTLSYLASSSVPSTLNAYVPISLVLAIPANCPTIRIFLQSNQIGTYNWDDVVLTQSPGQLGNGGFDQDSIGTGWVLPYSGQITSTGALSGNAFKNTGSSYVQSYASQDTPLKPGATYSLTAQVNGASHYLQADCIPSFGASSGLTFLASTSTVSTTTYTPQTLSFTVPATGCPYVRLFLDQPTGLNTDEFDSVTITKTAGAPNPATTSANTGASTGTTASPTTATQPARNQQGLRPGQPDPYHEVAPPPGLAPVGPVHP